MNLFLASAREWNLTFRMFSLETNWGAGACQGGNPTPEWKSEPLWVRISICVCARHIEILGHINPSVKPKVFGQKPNLAWLVLDRDHPEHFCPTRQFCLNQSSTCHGWCWLLGEAWRGSSTLLKHILGSLPKNAAFFRGSMWAFLSLIVFMGTGAQPPECCEDSVSVLARCLEQHPHSGVSCIHTAVLVGVTGLSAF